jgi:hypothetical protein
MSDIGRVYGSGSRDPGGAGTGICAWRNRSRLPVRDVRSQLFSCAARAEHQARTYTTGREDGSTTTGQKRTPEEADAPYQRGG